MPQSLRVTYAPGVTPGKWARIWNERFPHVQLELTMGAAVTDASAQLAVLRAGDAALAFVRLPQNPSGEANWPDGERPDDVHFIRLYEELPFVVAPKGNVVEAVDEVSVADLDGEVRHAFDDDIASTVEVVAANVGVVIVPQSIARLHARKDVVARPVTDVPGWRVGLAWLRTNDAPYVDDFIGVVRGRTANSSRGAAERDGRLAREAGNRDAGEREAGKRDTGKRDAEKRAATSGWPSADSRPTRRAGARPSRGGRRGRPSTR